jgi:hypothetical protein
MTLKEFETAYAIFRGELAQGRDPRKKGEQATAGAEEESEAGPRFAGPPGRGIAGDELG